MRKKYFRNPKGYIEHLVLSREEALVDTLAHEYRHFWQMNHPGKRGKVYAAKGKYPERDANARGIRKVREWRALHNSKDAIQQDPLNWRVIES